MPTSTATITVPQAERVLFRMCKHFAIKVPVTFDSEHADIDFLFGRCRAQRTGDVLSLHCAADSVELLQRVQHVIGAHLGLMARDKQLAVAWQSA
ncbi:DUF2218 domain-containing protein [Verminephrobacter aporrectodeae]|uniref:DUF2218 domain-containing protein n=1 Tax=Verminephrobacter aporrectodeae TaxID=1110389 RepID=UPI00023781F6|nr:DUF2218 domain-containing protein [Verminephrobacter aporrectodeae]